MTNPIDNDPEFAKEQRAFMLYDREGLARWLVVLASSHFWCDFAIYEAIGWEVDDESPLFEMKDRRAPDYESWSNNCATTMNGFVKWDGCTEFSAHAHFCDAAESCAKLYEVIQFTMRTARALMSEVAQLRGKEPNLDWDTPYTRDPLMYDAKAFELPEKWDPYHQSVEGDS